MEIAFSNSFQKAAKKKFKKNKEAENKFWEVVSIFIADPFDRRLRTHKLTGDLNNLWSFSVDYDFRIVFFFSEPHTKAVFVDLGTHDEVY